MYVTKCSDELWLEVKCLTNLAIAGSPRNIFRYSLCISFREVEILKGDGARKCTHSYQTPNARKVLQGVSDAEQFRVTKGKQPRPSAKVPNLC